MRWRPRRPSTRARSRPERGRCRRTRHCSRASVPRVTARATIPSGSFVLASAIPNRPAMNEYRVRGVGAVRDDARRSAGARRIPHRRGRRRAVAEEGLRSRHRVRMVGRRRHRQRQRPASPPISTRARCRGSKTSRSRSSSSSTTSMPHAPLHAPAGVRRRVPAGADRSRERGRPPSRRWRSTTARFATRITISATSSPPCKRRNLYDRTWIIVTADHGELFGEHGLIGSRQRAVSGGAARPVRQQAAARRRRSRRARGSGCS